MSQTIVLISSKSVDINYIEVCLNDLFLLQKNQSADGRIDIHVQKNDDFDASKISYVTIDQMLNVEDVVDDYVDNDECEDELRRNLRDCAFHIVYFNSTLLCNSLIEKIVKKIISDDMKCWIDTGYGKVINGMEYLINIDGHPNLDWAMHN